MSEPPTHQLSFGEVEHVARLARLRLSADQIERFRGDLSAILEHVARVSEVDTKGIEPMSHPMSLSNRLGADVPGPTMPLEDLLRNAPAVNGPFVAVPKVLDGDGGGA